MKYTLRDYQTAFCRASWVALEKGIEGNVFSRVLSCAGTGAGKTIMAAALIEQWIAKQRRCLFLADRDELCDQAINKMHKAAGIIADLEKAENRASFNSQVVVGSIQTMSSARRLERFAPGHFHRIICDEAHLSLAANWQRVLSRFHGGGAKILGITATPERGDGIPLMKFYEHMAYEIPLSVLIQRKQLSPIMVRTVPLHIDIKGKVGGGEMEDIAAELEAYTSAIIDAIETHAADRKRILIFHPSRAASRKFSAALNERRISSQHVQGDSPDRKEIIAGFEVGRFRVLNNAQMLTTGYDNDQIDCVIILRPTKSRTAFIQMAGRGTRLYCPHGCDEWCDHTDRKANMLLLDFLWQFPGMNVMRPACLVTDKPEHAKRVMDSLRSGSGTLDLLEVDAAAIGAQEEQMLEALKRASKKRAIYMDASTFGAVFHQPDLMEFQPTAEWEKRKISIVQNSILTRKGVDVRSLKGMGHASKLIAYIKEREGNGLATVKDVVSLKIAGHAGADSLTASEARDLLRQTQTV